MLKEEQRAETETRIARNKEKKFFQVHSKCFLQPVSQQQQQQHEKE